MRRATLGDVEVTAADIARIRQTNLHVPMADFAAFWAAAEAYHAQHSRDWYSWGVVETCRWLATAIVKPERGPWHPQRAPVTGRTGSAYEEIIEAECLKAEVLDMRRPVPEWLVEQPGWLAGVLGTLNWAWRRTAGPPLDLAQRATG